VSPRLWIALAVLLLAGCQTLGDRIGKQLRRDAPIDMKRSVDLLAPTGLRVNSTAERQIALAWDPVLVGAVSGYAILRAPAEGAFAPIGRTSSPFETVYVDSGRGAERLGDGQTYRYRVHTLDLDAKISLDHSDLQATTDPPPEPPSGLRAYSNLPRLVVLAWDPNESPEVRGYAVLRSPTLAGPWDRVTELEGRLATVHEDPVPGDLRVLYYRVVALNAFGGESETSDPIRAVTKAEPLPPIGLAVTRRELGSVMLAWKPNVERDLRGYRVFRAERSASGWGRERVIASPAREELAFRDARVGCGRALRYRMRAVDADGLESDFSDPLEVTSQDLGLAARLNANDGWLLEWEAKRAAAWPIARVSEVRWALPDRKLGEAPSSGPFRLGDLSAGLRRIGVTLVHAQATGRATPEPAPRCELVVRVPKTRP
jgi:fibronectin type 3 domain-containing protein